MSTISSNIGISATPDGVETMSGRISTFFFNLGNTAGSGRPRKKKGSLQHPQKKSSNVLILYRNNTLHEDWAEVAPHNRAVSMLTERCRKALILIR